MKPFCAPTVCKISVRGTIPEEWKDCLTGLQLSVMDQEHITILAGQIKDQTALQGILQSLYTIGLPLISINCEEPCKDEPLHPDQT